MWRFYPFLASLWGLVVITIGLGLMLGVIGNCAYDELSAKSSCTLALDLRDLIRPSVLGVIVAFLLILGLRLKAKHSYERHEALNSFALLKPIEKLSPDDFGFQVVRPGDRPDTYKRPFYHTYVTRSASEVGDGKVYTDAQLVEALQEGKGLVLLGQPLDGKSRTLYEIVNRMDGYRVVSPSPSKDLPRDEHFSLLKGERVILLLEDLQNYVGRQLGLLEFHKKLVDYASSCVVASTCRDGPEQKVVEQSLNRLYEGIDLKLRLVSPTTEDKELLVRSIGEDWHSERSDDYPTLGSITMERPMEAMALRFSNLLHERPQVADTLRALKLLSAAGILPFTHSRIEAVLKTVFGRHEIHLHDQLRILAKQSFLQHWEAHERTVQPEPAYLRDAVTYTEGKEPKVDFSKLADMLEGIDDHRGLNNLGITYLNLQEYDSSIDCFERAVEILTKLKGREDPATLRVRNNVGVPLKSKEDLDGALRVYEEVLEAQKRVLGARHHDVASTLLNIGSALREKGLYHEVLPRYQETLVIREEALAKTNLEDPERRQLLSDLTESLHNIGATLMDLGRYREASPYFERALGIYERDLNDITHYRYAGTVMMLGSALRAQKDYRDARARLEQALTIHRRILPEGHTDIAKNLMSLGALLDEQANRDESLSATEQEEALSSARRHLEEVLTLSEALYGTDHGMVGGILRVLASIAHVEDRLEDERLYSKRAETIRKTFFASVDADTASELHRGAMALAARGLYEEAMAYQERYLQLQVEAFGEKSLEAAASLFALSRLLLLQGLDEQARPCLEQVLVAREEFLGAGDPATKIVREILATLSS